jgi:hypothetical protein
MSENINDSGQEMTANAPMCDAACDQAQPFAELPTPEPVCRCGAEWHQDGDRCVHGHPRPGTPGPALTHGARSLQVRLALLAECRAALSERRNGILADLGGRDDLSIIRTDMVERYLETSLLAEWLGGNLLAEGALTAKGKARAAATLYLQVLDRLSRLASTLGLDRRARRLNVAEQCAVLHATEPRCD